MDRGLLLLLAIHKLIHAFTRFLRSCNLSLSSFENESDNWTILLISQDQMTQNSIWQKEIFVLLQGLFFLSLCCWFSNTGKTSCPTCGMSRCLCFIKDFPLFAGLFSVFRAICYFPIFHVWLRNLHCVKLENKQYSFVHAFVYLLILQGFLEYYILSSYICNL